MIMALDRQPCLSGEQDRQGCPSYASPLTQKEVGVLTAENLLTARRMCEAFDEHAMECVEETA